MVIIGLGSNIGNRLQYLNTAVGYLSAFINDMRFSRIYESDALLPPEATPDMDRPFYNMVLSGDTLLSPQDLLIHIKQVEKDMGRVTRCYWGPREIDIDIIAMDDVVLGTTELSIPHKEMLNRPFVLQPMAEVASNWAYPAPGPFFQCTIAEIIAVSELPSLPDTGLRIEH